MAARTNKRGIAAKKMQLAKQASRMKGQKRFEYPKRKVSIEEAMEFGFVGSKENPKGKAYHRFLKGRKICWETKMRIDPDGYRLVKVPSGGLEFVHVQQSGYVRNRLIKTFTRR